MQSITANHHYLVQRLQYRLGTYTARCGVRHFTPRYARRVCISISLGFRRPFFPASRPKGVTVGWILTFSGLAITALALSNTCLLRSRRNDCSRVAAVVACPVVKRVFRSQFQLIYLRTRGRHSCRRSVLSSQVITVRAYIESTESQHFQTDVSPY